MEDIRRPVAATDPRTPDADGWESSPALAAGVDLGPYRILARLGSGGMGVVYLAEDPRLGRRVAIKVVNPATAEEGHARLLREARAMARLSDANIVTVHEADVSDGHVFVVMEYVDGKTLDGWLRARSRTTHEIVDAFIRAGRGLAAAHRAGLVHRDFKPENVLIDRLGEVRVTDFGLVADVGSAGERAGQGTPAYMAPEQHLGLRVDAAADQFAFCVTLYEALYGERPFPGETVEQIGERKLAGSIAAPAAAARVPRRLRAAVLRGLATRPADRHPSMDALLAALARAGGRARSRWLIPAAAVLGVCGVGGVVAVRAAAPPPRHDPCEVVPGTCRLALSTAAGCVDDLGGIGAGPFEISFVLQTACTKDQAVISQRADCNVSDFWAARVRGGRTLFELFHSNFQRGTAWLSNVPITDGRPHRIRVRREGQLFWFYVDENLEKILITPPTDVVGLVPLRACDGDPCIGVDGVQPFAGTIGEICLRRL